MNDVYLKPGRDKAVRNRHPWVFSGAIARIVGADDGAIVAVRSASGEFLAWGYLNRRSQITIRLLSWDEQLYPDSALWQRRITAAIGRRAQLHSTPHTTAYRLIHAGADLLPGLIADRYGDFVVVQFLTLGAERWQQATLNALNDALAPRGIYERSDVGVREREGLPPRTGLLCGDAPPPLLEIAENGHRFLVDIAHGQKTGFYLDQRENRALLSRYADGREVLNAFAYTGAFSLYALSGGAIRATSLDSSAEALELARRNLALNGHPSPDQDFLVGDAFHELRRYRDQGRKFDLIVLDPPRFAPTRRHVERAARAYKDINLLAFKLLRPGGMLFTFSCSGGIDTALFQKIVFAAAADAHRDVQILHYMSQGPDHPVLLSFPESAYLKGLACLVI